MLPEIAESTFRERYHIHDALDDIADARKERDDARRELAEARALACRFYNADGSYMELDRDEVIRRRIDAAIELNALRTECDAAIAKRDKIAAERLEFAQALVQILGWVRTFRMNEPPPSLAGELVSMMHRARELVEGK